MADMVSKITTLCYIINKQQEVLLVMKKRDFGVGKWNGPGGKVKIGEEPLAAGWREVEEETGLKMIAPKELGYLEFIWPKELQDWNQRTYIYLAQEFEGELRESDECLPQWFKFDEIPYDQMWDDDQYWYPAMLRGEKIKKRFFFNKEGKVLNFEDLANI